MVVFLFPWLLALHINRVSQCAKSEPLDIDGAGFRHLKIIAPGDGKIIKI